jgi:hypothetical protein
MTYLVSLNGPIDVFWFECCLSSFVADDGSLTSRKIFIFVVVVTIIAVVASAATSIASLGKHNHVGYMEQHECKNTNNNHCHR